MSEPNANTEAPVEVIDVVRYNIFLCSQAIAACKKDAADSYIKFMQPKCGDWDKYKSFKRECSQWLTALRLVRSKKSWYQADFDNTHFPKARVFHEVELENARADWMDEAVARLNRIKDRIEKGAKSVKFTWNTKEGRLEELVSHTPVSFVKAIEFKKEYEKRAAERRVQATEKADVPALPMTSVSRE